MQESEGSSKKLFGDAKWARSVVGETLAQVAIPSLKGREGIAITIKKKVEVMFKTHFSSPSKMLMNDTQDYDYASLIENGASIMKREVRRAIHKIVPNKASRFNEVTNRALRHLVSVASTQMRFLFAKCIKKRI